jgi:hypothetical protein
MKSALILLSLPLVIFSLSDCRKEADPRIAQLQKDVRQLSEENKNLKNELQNVHDEMIATQTAVAAKTPESQPQTGPIVASGPQMTVEGMKHQLQPLLVDFIQKLKAAGDTPHKGSQYGMRIEYDLTKAVYGLIQNNDPDEPFRGKVIVPYKKFLESQTDSRFYGEGTTQFIFTFQDGHWALQTFQ